MRHIVEVKMPRIFGKKKEKVDSETELRTQVDLDEQVKTVDIPTPIFIGGLVFTSITVGYLVGYKQGVEKGGKIVIFK